MKADIAGCIISAIETFEQTTGERVGALWLNTEEVQKLFRRLDVFDVAANGTIIAYLTEQGGAPFIGYVFGAPVFQTDKVAPGCVFITGESSPYGPIDGDRASPLPA